MDPISVLALIFSILSLVLTLYFEQHRTKEELQFEQLHLQSDRNTACESKLAEWPEALKFYGIDVGQAVAKGISAEQITYLVLSINAMTVECAIKKISALDYLKESDYRQLMFSQKTTRLAWKYASQCISKEWRLDIDRYLSEKYPEENEDLK